MQYFKTFYLGILLSTTAWGQASAPQIIAIQQAKIAQLEEQLKNVGCGAYGNVVYNSVANLKGKAATGDRSPRRFWNIPYADRFKEKGEPTTDLSRNYYNGALYLKGPAIYTDLIEDLHGKVFVAFRAQAEGFNPATMGWSTTKLLSGSKYVFDHNFAGGWSAPDYDGDGASANCAVSSLNVTQHYGVCWVYNLASDNENGTTSDDDWGPHLDTRSQIEGNIASDGTTFTRVMRITRCQKLL